MPRAAFEEKTWKTNSRKWFCTCERGADRLGAVDVVL